MDQEKCNVEFTGDLAGKQVTSRYSKKLEKYSKKWNTDIVVAICHGSRERVPNELEFDKLYIFTQLLPESINYNKAHVPSFKINNKEITLPIKEDATDGPCPQGDTLSFDTSLLPNNAKIIADENKVPMAVIYDTAIYILNDITHCRNEKEFAVSMEIFDYILDQSVNKTDFLDYLKAGMEEKSKRALVLALEAQFSKSLEKEKLQFKAARDTITQYEKGIVECQKKVIVGERIIEAIKNNMEDVPKALNKTWESIARLKDSSMYTNISFTKTSIKAETTPISIKYNANEYDMGRFEVIMKFTGETLIAGIDNLGKSTNHPHPHISGSNPCWGNFSGQIPKLIGSSEFDVALVTIHTWLSHYDKANPYSTIEDWPKKEK